jgi:hypothetical protein
MVRPAAALVSFPGVSSCVSVLRNAVKNQRSAARAVGMERDAADSLARETRSEYNRSSPS